MEAISINQMINDVFNQRKARNPRYSYRAYARDMGVSQSLLSKVLVGKRKVTPEFALRLGMGMNLPDSELIKLVISVLPKRNL